MIRTTDIITPAVSSDLTTLATVKDALMLAEDDATSDLFLSRAIRAASAWASTYCGRTFGSHVRCDTFRIDNLIGCVLGIDRDRRATPLSLSYDRLAPAAVSQVSLFSGPLDPSNYVVEAEAGLLWRVSSSGVTVRWLTQVVTATYTAGWTLPGQPSQLGKLALPAIVEDAVIDRVVASYTSRGRDQTIIRERVQDVGDIYYQPINGDAAVGDPRLDPFRLRQD